jgi:hypothetical protein
MIEDLQKKIIKLPVKGVPPGIKPGGRMIPGIGVLSFGSGFGFANMITPQRGHQTTLHSPNRENDTVGLLHAGQRTCITSVITLLQYFNSTRESYPDAVA